ncbi:MAG: histidine kinase [Actinomycetota bacterium]|nr:histidine kinase [Actinomycetota bacterium]
MISEQASERTDMLSGGRLARFLWAFSVVLVALSAVLLVLNRNVEDPVAPYWLNLAASALALSTVGALLASRRPENPIGWLLGASGLLYAVLVAVGEYGAYALLTEGGSMPGGVVAAWLGSWLYVLGANLVVYSFLLFPDGRLPSPRWRAVAWLVAFAICLDTASLALIPGTLYGYPGVENPFGIEALAGLSGPIGVVTGVLVLVAILTPVIALIARFRRARGDERQQIKWVLYAVAVLVAAIVAVNLWPTLDPSFVGAVMFLVGFLAIPAAIGVAIFKYRLYDIDLVINRTLVYAALTVCVVGIYILVVGYLGALLRTDDNLIVSLVATGIVAVLFAPLRDRLQRGVNRLMYGERDDPYAVLSRLGDRLGGTLAPEAVLPTVVRTVREALKLPYAAIALKEGKDLAVAAESGSSVDEALRLPLVHQGEKIGELLLAPRAPGESFTPADRSLLDDLAQQAGIAVHAVHLTNDLQRARERLVSAREEERRRLRRDLHDGLGPQLSSQALTIDAALTLLRRDPDSAEALLLDLRAQAQDAVSDIRRLVYALRPPALDDLGLLGALRETAARYGQNGLRVSVNAPEPLPPLPAAVEVATYRIAQEAMTNVARHAAAHACSVSLEIDDGARMLRLEVRDDGRGLPNRWAGAPIGTGVGLTSMRERTAELGGTLVVETFPEEGTSVRAELPLFEEE